MTQQERNVLHRLVLAVKHLLVAPVGEQAEIDAATEVVDAVEALQAIDETDQQIDAPT